VNVEFARSARRSLQELPAPRRRQIVARIEAFATRPTSREFDVRPLAGSDLYRLRVGSYRVLMTIDRGSDRIVVKLIRSRGDVYKR